MSLFLSSCREKMRLQHKSIRTEKSYIRWIERFIRFHSMRHPSEMGVQEVEVFLTHLAVEEHVARATQDQAFNALCWMYRDVLETPLQGIKAVRSKKPQKIPVVLSQAEVLELLQLIRYRPHHCLALLFYSCGLCLMEGVRLRVKDLDFDQNYPDPGMARTFGYSDYGNLYARDRENPKSPVARRVVESDETLAAPISFVRHWVNAWFSGDTSLIKAKYPYNSVQILTDISQRNPAVCRRQAV